MPEKINYRSTYRDVNSFDDRQLSIIHDGSGDVHIDIGPHREDGTLVADKSFTISRSDLTELAISWLDVWGRKRVEHQMKFIPANKRGIRPFFYNGKKTLMYHISESEDE